MSALADSRSIAYSADTAGRAGRIACHVIRSGSGDGLRVGYSIVVRNETAGDARATAFIPAALDARPRTLVQSVIGAHSVFSTSVEVQVEGESVPDLHVHIRGDDIDFALIAPRTKLEPEHPERTEFVAMTAVVANGGAHAARAIPLPFAALLSAQRRDPPYRASMDGMRDVSTVGPSLLATLERSPALAPGCVLLLAAAAAIGGALFRPQVGALDLPAHAAGGVPIVVGYRATGIGTITYHVTGPLAQPIGSGTLAPGSGTFAVTLPESRTARTYRVRITSEGALGVAMRDGSVRVAAPIVRAAVVAAPPRDPRDSAPPQIRSLALDRALVAGGDTLNVYYDVAATSGSVALLDAGSQITYGTSPLSASGHSAFVVPAGDTQRFMTVVLSAQRGGASTQSRIAVTVAAPASPTPLPAPSGSGATDAAIEAAPPLVTAPKTVRSGLPIRIEVSNAVAGMVLVLSDNDGTELARRDVAIAGGTTIFDAPDVTTATTIRLQAVYPQGSGSETIVHPIEVLPH